jgi:exopolyphosphatase/guanosine-5'-triphosphate,3'-diphosphate pyrophosphatase
MTMEKKLAIIDLGTNTFHLLIAENVQGKYEIIHRERSAVKIGVGGINHDVIHEEGIVRAVEALRNFKNVIDQHDVSKVFAFGTSALRNAQNTNDVIARIKQTCDIVVTIISGNEEAEFIYKGIRSALDLGDCPSLIVDIGGGSVEFIIANKHEISWKRSFEIGGQRLLEKFQKHDPMTENEIKDLNNYFDSSLTELFQVLQKFQPTSLVGSSGTFDTLSEIYCAHQSISYRETDSETPLTLQSFYSTYQELITKDRAQRLQIPGMIDLRVDMIVVACCLIRYLLEKHTFNNIRVSTYSLKEGVLAHLSENNK